MLGLCGDGNTMWWLQELWLVSLGCLCFFIHVSDSGGDCWDWKLQIEEKTQWSAAFQPTTSSQAISTANLLITLITQPRKEFKHGNFMSVVSYSGIREGEPSHGCSNAQRGWNTVNTVAVENIIKAGYSLFSKLSDHFIIPTRISTVFDQWHWGFSKLRFACGFCIKDLYRAAP